MIEFAILGPLAIMVDAAPVPLPGSRRRAVLLRLLVEAAQVVPTDRLVDDVWEGEAPAGAAGTLRSHVSFLRKTLGDQCIRHSSGGYVLDAPDAQIDSELFEKELAQARSALSNADPATAEIILTEALGRWRGEALSDVAGAPWALPVATRLEELRLGAVESRLEALLSLGRDGEAVAAAESAVVEHPLRERLWTHVMLGLYRSGRQAEALRAYQRMRTRFAEELGLEPSRELVALEKAIIQRDTALDWLPIRSRSAGQIARVRDSDSERSAPTLPSGLVTLLHSDIEGSTRIWESSPDAMAPAMVRYDELMQSAMDTAGGYVFKTAHDAFWCAFSSATDAVAAVVEAQRALAAENWPKGVVIRARMGLHTGRCDERNAEYFGPPVNRTERLTASAIGGQVLLSGMTSELVRDELPEGVGLRDLGEHRLRDLSTPEHVYQLDVPGLITDFEPIRSLDNPQLRHNLPEQLSCFVGRAAELSAVRDLLESHRLVTLVGTGGSGKTRLALQVAAELVDGSHSGVWLVELASLTDRDMVGATVAAALAVPEESGRTATACLVDSLRDRSLLLVLDNCEHVLDACAQLADVVLRSCADVAILATSRQALGVEGELVHRVPSLAVPPMGAVDVAEVGMAEAVQLFIDRARLHEPSFSLERSNARSVSRICQRLDGIPLALELAAARLRSLSTDQIESRLDDRFRLLTTGGRVALPRQQTLGALVGWSYDLLSEDEQAVLCCLAVFNGGFDLSTATAVCSLGTADDWEMLDRLTALVDKSLVQVQVWGEAARYSMLETIRHYAWARLVERRPDGTRRLRDRHAEAFSALAVGAAAHQDGPEQRHWLARLDLERDNLRGAQTHLISIGRSDAAAVLAISLGWYWLARAHYQEGIDTLEAVLVQLPTKEGEIRRAHVLLALAKLHAWQGDLKLAMAASDEGLAIARHSDDVSLVAELLLVGANARRLAPREAAERINDALALARRTADSGLIARILIERAFLLRSLDRPGADDDLAEALERLRQRGDATRLAQLLNNLGYIAMEDGDLEMAAERFSEAHELAEALQHTAYALLFTLNLGLVAVLQGNVRKGEEFFGRALQAALEADERGQVPYALFGLALCLGGSADEDERATTLHGAAEELLRKLSQEFDGIEAKLRERDLQERRRRMGEARFLSAYEAGRAMPQHKAAGVALERA